MPSADVKLNSEGDTTGSSYYFDCFVYNIIGSSDDDDDDDTLWMDSMGIMQEQATIMYPCNVLLHIH